MKKLLLSILFVFSLVSLCLSSPSNSVSLPNSFSPNTVIQSSQANSNFNEVQSKFNAHTHSDITSLGTVTSGTWNAGVVQSTYGGTGHTNTGILLPSGAVFFMMTGSCPDGSTDVTATYSNQFIRVNATQGSTGGATTDSITLTTNELPAHTHTVGIWGQGALADSGNITGQATTNETAEATSSTGSGAAFSVDTVPPYVTCKLCQVD